MHAAQIKFTGTHQWPAAILWAHYLQDDSEPEWWNYILNSGSSHDFSEHKAGLKFSWYKNTSGQRTMIDFVIASSDLQPYVLDT